MVKGAAESVERAVRQIQEGGLVVVVDDEGRENEGDLVCAAVHATPETINFMAREARGLICAPMLSERLDTLGIPPMSRRNRDPHGTAFSVSVDAVEGITTGISAKERSRTILKLIDPSATPNDLRQPGHVFPLRSHDGGVLARAGHTEATIDLCALAGLPQAGVICEILQEDGEMMRMSLLMEFAARHELPLLTIADLIDHLLETRPTVSLSHKAILKGSNTKILLFEGTSTGLSHIAFVVGSPQPDKPCLVRVHSEKADRRVPSEADTRLQKALSKLEAEGEGVLVLLKVPAQGNAPSWPAETPMDFRSYGVGAQILRACGVGRMRVITNNVRNIIALEGFGLEIVETLPLDP